MGNKPERQATVSKIVKENFRKGKFLNVYDLSTTLNI